MTKSMLISLLGLSRKYRSFVLMCYFITSRVIQCNVFVLVRNRLYTNNNNKGIQKAGFRL